jgi:hypothetical protein
MIVTKLSILHPVCNNRPQKYKTDEVTISFVKCFLPRTINNVTCYVIMYALDGLASKIGIIYLQFQERHM